METTNKSLDASRCPVCGSPSRVVSSPSGFRRRKCTNCAYAFKTRVEIITHETLVTERSTRGRKPKEVSALLPYYA